MKVIGLTWTAFRLPFREAFHTAGGSLTQRQGLLLRLATDAGFEGLGEASPHPALGPLALRDVQEALERLGPRLLETEVADIESLNVDIPPALACALDVAACDALARARGIGIARLLSEQLQPTVPVNALIGAETVAQAAFEAAAARRNGFRCVKLKVGTAMTPTAEAERVAAVRRALGPHIELRLDANGAWGPEQAIVTIRALAGFDLELIEQPVAAADLDGLARLRAAVNVPIAADEAVASLEAARRVLEADATDVLVVKPMVVGGLRPARRIIELAAAAGAEAIVTTTIDSGVGTAAALHLAATLPPGSRACGLATGTLLAGDLVRNPPLTRAGEMDLPDGPGLGVDLDNELLARFTVKQGALA